MILPMKLTIITWIEALFKEGDAIVKDDSNQRFIVGETDSLEGVLLHQSRVCGIPSGRYTGSE